MLLNGAPENRFRDLYISHVSSSSHVSEHTSHILLYISHHISLYISHIAIYVFNVRRRIDVFNVRRRIHVRRRILVHIILYISHAYPFIYLT